MAALYEEFCALDKDNSGQLEYPEIMAFIDALCVRDPDVFDREDMINRVIGVDKNFDGKMSWPEFKALIFDAPPEEQNEQQDQPQQN